MSWLKATERFRDLFCKLQPHGKTCEDHLKVKYPECFQTQSRLYFLLALPQKAWRYVVPAKECDDVSNTPNTDHCSQLLQNDDSSLVGCIWKFLILIAVSIGILYAIIKVSAQRRASLQ